MAPEKSQKRGIHLVKPEPEQPEQLLRKSMAMKFRVGEIIPQSGIYRVTHSGHRLPHEVTLLRGNAFPPCAQCRNQVEFKLVRMVEVGRFSVTLNALPELPDGTRSFFAADGDEEKIG